MPPGEMFVVAPTSPVSNKIVQWPEIPPHMMMNGELPVPPPPPLCERVNHICQDPLKTDIMGRRPSLSTTDASGGASGDELDAEKDAESKEATMMICNIPCRFGYEHIVEAVDSAGFADVYDFVYLPYHARKGQGNIGYAFVHFKKAEDAYRFADVFQNYQFQGTKSTKRVTVKLAHMQGFNACKASMSRGSKRRAMEMQPIQPELWQ